MSSAWLLPEHIADVLPAQARRIEELRRSLLDRARGYGFELVMPPLLEHLESLLSGTGRELDLQTFKLVDQLSGRTLGLRADTTPQVARIDAHLLNRQGVTRLCYCGPVLHTRPQRPARDARAAAVRRRDLRPRRPGGRPGSAGAGARLPAAPPASTALVIDLADARVRARRAGRRADRGGAAAGRGARRCRTRTRRRVESLSRGFPAETRAGAARPAARCTAATRCWTRRAACCRSAPLIARGAGRPALAGQRTCSATIRGVQLGFDLADMSGYAYYSGARFAVYGAGSQRRAGARRPLRRGRRGVRPQPAGGGLQPGPEGAGRACAGAAPGRAPCARPGARTSSCARRCAACASRARPWCACCRATSTKAQEFDCDRELVAVDGHWVLRAL